MPAATMLSAIVKQHQAAQVEVRKENGTRIGLDAPLQPRSGAVSLGCWSRVLAPGACRCLAHAWSVVANQHRSHASVLFSPTTLCGLANHPPCVRVPCSCSCSCAAVRAGVERLKLEAVDAAQTVTKTLVCSLNTG